MTDAPLMSQAQLEHALRHPQWTLDQLDRVDSEESLLAFARGCWHVLEPPSRPFVEGRAIQMVAEHLEAVTRGEIRRLVINIPPGFMKSLLVSVMWPAWEWGPKNMPGLRYILTSYSSDLTIRDNRRCRRIIESPWYERIWGENFELTSDQNAKERYDNNHTGFRIATSVAGVGTGERGDRVIIDDPHNVREAESESRRESVLQWFTEVMPTRINDPARSAIVVIMQRVHQHDLSGHIISKELGYEHLCLPMEYEHDHPHRCAKDWRRDDGELLWPERFTQQYLETDLKPTLSSWGGSYAIAGQLQQRPSPRGGGMFKTGKLRYIDAPLSGGICVRGWDFAGSESSSAAWTAGVRLRMLNGSITIEDVVRRRVSPAEFYDLVESTARRDGFETIQDFPQDPGQASLTQVHLLASKLHGLRFHFGSESGSKEDRALPFAAQVEAGNVAVVRSGWTDTYISEMNTFPTGYKDQIDATSRGYSRILRIMRQQPADVAAPEVVQ